MGEALPWCGLSARPPEMVAEQALLTSAEGFTQLGAGLCAAGRVRAQLELAAIQAGGTATGRGRGTNGAAGLERFTVPGQARRQRAPVCVCQALLTGLRRLC